MLNEVMEYKPASSVGSGLFRTAQVTFGIVSSFFKTTHFPLQDEEMEEAQPSSPTPPSPSGLPKFTSSFVPPAKRVYSTAVGEAEGSARSSLEMMCKHMMELMGMEIWSHRKSGHRRPHGRASLVFVLHGVGLE